jgi:predicted MFS family arabinose efflux permease
LDREGRNEGQRAFLLLALATFCTGFAMAGNQNIVSNYFEDVLGLSGPQFGYITAIREIPGFLLIFLTALFYRLSLPRLTTLALLVLAVGYGFFGVSNSFWTVAPWVVISSIGYHTWLQVQYALGMSTTTEDRSGHTLGRLSAVNQGGALVAMAAVLIAFHFNLLAFRAAFVITGVMALFAAVIIFRFPVLHRGQVRTTRDERKPIVYRKDYRLYYLLSLLDGARQQIFFSFGLWVLVDHYALDVPQISAILLVVTGMSMVAGPWIGRVIDLRGERFVLGFVNVAYVVALLGYAVAESVGIAVLCYVIYSFIFPLSAMGAAIYLQKIAPNDDVAPSLAMGVTLQHVAAIAVPIATGYILNFVGYQIPFLAAAGFAIVAIFVTRALNPATQRSEAKIREDEARKEPAAGAVATAY